MILFENLRARWREWQARRRELRLFVASRPWWGGYDPGD